MNNKTETREAVGCTAWLDADWWKGSTIANSYKLERNLRVAAMRLEGKSYAAIGRAMEVNGTRIKQIIADIRRRVDRRQAWLNAKAANNVQTET